MKKLRLFIRRKYWIKDLFCKVVFAANMFKCRFAKMNQAAVSAPASCSVFRFVQGMFQPKGLMQPVGGLYGGWRAAYGSTTFPRAP